MIVDVSKRGKARPNTFSQFCSMPALDILGKIINVVFALPKGNVQHEFSLRCIFKPVGRKFQVFNLSCVQEVDNLSSIYGISGETIWVPTQNPVCFP